MKGRARRRMKRRSGEGRSGTEAKTQTHAEGAAGKEVDEASRRRALRRQGDESSNAAESGIISAHVAQFYALHKQLDAKKKKKKKAHSLFKVR